MKLNFTKYYLGVILLGLCVASPKVGAFTISDVLSSTLTESLVVDSDLDFNIQYWGPGLTLYGYGSVSDSVVTDFSSKNFKSFFRITSPGTGSPKLYTTMVSMSSNGQGGGVLKWWSESDGEYFDYNIPSSAGFTRNFPDGESCLMDQVFFTIGSAVFYSSGCDRTLQIMAGGNVWTDYFLYIDPYPNHTTNNLWLVSLSRDVAWSTSVSNAVAGDLMLAKITPSQQTVLNIFNDNGYISYTVSGGGSNFRPTDPAIPGFVGQGGFAQGLPLVYSRDLQLNPLPEWNGGSGNNNVDFSGNFVDFSQSVDYLGSCMSRFENLRSYTEAYYKCQVSSDGDPAGEMLFNGGGLSGSVSYTGDNTWCSRFAQLHNSFFIMYENNWAVPYYYDGSGPYDLQNLYDPKAPFVNLAYSWIAYSVRLDENNNVVGLPSGNGICDVASETESDFSLDLSNLYDRLGIGNIETPFYSGYNSVLSGGLSCVNDNTVNHTIGNIIVTFAGSLIILILFFLL